VERVAKYFEVVGKIVPKVEILSFPIGKIMRVYGLRENT
jgi:hypothetical protein